MWCSLYQWRLCQNTTSVDTGFINHRWCPTIHWSRLKSFSHFHEHGLQLLQSVNLLLQFWNIYINVDQTLVLIINFHQILYATPKIYTLLSTLSNCGQHCLTPHQAFLRLLCYLFYKVEVFSWVVSGRRPTLCSFVLVFHLLKRVI